MADIQVDFNQYMPAMSTFYSYFQILKKQHFIQDILVVEKNGQNLLRVCRFENTKLPID